MTNHETALEAAAAVISTETGICGYSSTELAKSVVSAYLSTLSPDVSGLVKRLLVDAEYCADRVNPSIRLISCDLTEAADALASLSLQLAVAEGAKHENKPRVIKVPEGQTPLNPDLGHRLLDVFNEGREARKNGTGSPYHGHSLEHCIHASGWVQQDLRMALDTCHATPPSAQETDHAE